MNAHKKMHYINSSLDECYIYGEHKRANDIKVTINYSMLDEHTKVQHIC